MMNLKDHPDILARITSTAGVITLDLVMDVLKKAFPQIKNIWIGDAQYNSGVEG